MNYSRHYSLLINRAVGRTLEGYIEKHHVLPRCMGGSDEPENLVRLTAREHFVAHQLLVKMYPGVGKLIFAVMVMTSDPHGYRVGNRRYGWLRERHSEHCKLPEVVDKRRAIMLARHLAGDPALERGLRAIQAPEARKKAVATRIETAKNPAFRARESLIAKRRWETRDKSAVRERMIEMNARGVKTRGSQRVVVETLPNGFIVNEHLNIKALAEARGVTYKALYQQIRAGHPTMELLPK